MLKIKENKFKFKNLHVQLSPIKVFLVFCCICILSNVFLQIKRKLNVFRAKRFNLKPSFHTAAVLLTVFFKIVAVKLSNVSLQGTADKLDNLNSVPIQIIEAKARPKKKNKRIIQTYN